ncbi:MAG: transposase [Mangrovibacterium sp.]
MDTFFGINGKLFQRRYKDKLSDYHQWEQKSHAEDWILHEENIGEYLSIDETSPSCGELYTVVTNKAGKGKKGTIVAFIKGTASDAVITVLKKIPEAKRRSVKEVTLDMAGSMNKIVRSSFPCAQLVIDRFHVQKLAQDALNDMRVALRWKAIDEENNAITNAKQSGERYTPFVFSNGDTQKQLLARSRYLLFKSREKWTKTQEVRAKILFENYPTLKTAYNLVHKLRMIYNNTEDKAIASHWYNDVADADFKKFNTVTNTIYNHYKEILNFFDNRNTNASAESFNAKIKDFRRNLKGVADVKYFLFRLTKIYA